MWDMPMGGTFFNLDEIAMATWRSGPKQTSPKKEEGFCFDSLDANPHLLILRITNHFCRHGPTVEVEKEWSVLPHCSLNQPVFQIYHRLRLWPASKRREAVGNMPFVSLVSMKKWPKWSWKRRPAAQRNFGGCELGGSTGLTGWNWGGFGHRWANEGRWTRVARTGSCPAARKLTCFALIFFCRMLVKQ